MEDQRYQKGKIYRITDIGYNKCYIGSTIELLSKRMGKHRSKYKSYLQGKYEFNTSFNIFEEYGVEFCKIELIELYPCNSKAELEAREGYYIRSEDCVNTRIEGRTNKERHHDFKYNHKQYKIDNHEHIRQTAVAYYENNKEQMAVKHKHYKIDNQEHIAEKQKDYYENNKESINARRREQRKSKNYKPG